MIHIEKLLSYFAYYFRPFFIIKFLKFNKKYSIIKKIISIYDPNNIRKKISLKLKNKNIFFKKNNLRFKLDINDHIAYNFFINEKWNDIPIKIAKKIGFNKNDIFVDIGANTGLVSVPFANEFDCCVIAVEASQKNGEFLKKNISDNNLNIKPVIKFLSSDKTELKTKLFSFNGNNGAKSFYENWNPSLSKTEYEIVENTTLDHELKDYQIDKIKIIKLDIEGYEFEVLKNFKLLNQIKAVIVFEYNVNYLKKIYNKDYDILLRFLKSDFDLYFIENLDDNKINLKKINHDESSEVVAIPKKFRSNYKSLIIQI